MFHVKHFKAYYFDRMFHVKHSEVFIQNYNSIPQYI